MPVNRKDSNTDNDGFVRTVSIRQGMTLVTGSVILLLASVSLIAWLLYNSLENALDQTVRETLPTVVATRTLAMSGKGLSILATEMILVEDNDELNHKSSYASLVSLRLEEALVDVRERLHDDKILLNLQQICNQVISSLEELGETVKAKLDHTARLNSCLVSLTTEIDVTTQLLISELKTEKADLTSISPGSRSHQYQWKSNYYLEMLSLITEAQRIIQKALESQFLHTIQDRQALLRNCLERFDTLSKRTEEEKLLPAFNRYIKELSHALKSEDGLFTNHIKLLDIKAHEQSLVISIQRLTSQFELLTATVVERANTQAEQLNQMAAQKILKTKWAMLMFLLISLVAAVLLIRFFAGRRVADPLMALVKTVRTIENGDLNVRASQEGAEEIRELASSFNRMTEKLVHRTQEITELHALLDSVLNSLSSTLIAVDIQMNVMLWNNQAEKLFNKTRKNIEGKDIFQAILPFPMTRETILKTIEENLPKAVRKIPVKTWQGSFIFDVVVFPLHFATFKGAVIRIDDVTEKTRIEEIMVQSEKMLSVGGLAAGMAHEINNPLSGILQNAQVILNRLTKDLPANHKKAEELGTSLAIIKDYMEARGIVKLLHSMQEAGLRAADIVKNMLSFSRKEGGGASSTHNLNDLLDKTISLAENDYNMKKQLDFRQINIIRDYDTTLRTVLCESSKLQQVFLNILKNGAEAMAEKRQKQINLSVSDGEVVPSRFIIRTRGLEDRVRIEIEDNGPGMEVVVRKRIFEPFFTTKPVGLGTGLGLSISYFIVIENHGGTMEVKSEPGLGSTFIIELPFERRNPLEESLEHKKNPGPNIKEHQ